MLAPGPATHRVRCRQIAAADLPALAELLVRGFPSHDLDYWTRGLARIAALPVIEGVPQFGYALESDGELVGVLLTISSRRGSRILSNVSSWYVRHSYRAHSSLLVAMATKLKHVTYLNASPAPHTWRTLEAIGCKPYNMGRSAAFPVLGLGGGKVRRTIPDDLPEAGLLRAHRDLGCVSVVCEKDGAVHPFVFKPRRLDHPPLPMMELIYCRATADFESCGAALGRHFLMRGVPGFIVDGKVEGMVSRYVVGKEPRFYKGPEAPTLNDLAFTEKVIFG